MRTLSNEQSPTLPPRGPLTRSLEEEDYNAEDDGSYVPDGNTLRVKVYLPNKHPIWLILKRDATVQDTIEKTIRKANARIVEVNPTFCSVMMSGVTEDIKGLYFSLAKFNCVLQYTRSGRIAITRNTVEEVSDFLEMQEQNKNKNV